MYAIPAFFCSDRDLYQHFYGVKNGQYLVHDRAPMAHFVVTYNIDLVLSNCCEEVVKISCQFVSLF